MRTFFYIGKPEERANIYRQINVLREYAEENDLVFGEGTIIKAEPHPDGSIDELEGWYDLEWRLNENCTVVFKNLSFFPFRYGEGYRKYMELFEKGVSLVFIEDPTMSTDYIKDLAEEAKDMDIISEAPVPEAVRLLVYSGFKRIGQEKAERQKKIKEGLADSYSRPGRKTGKFDKLTPELESSLTDLIVKGGSQTEIMIEHNISRNTLKRYLAYVEEFNRLQEKKDRDEMKDRGEDGEKRDR
ncbi:MAG: hypothetical protein K6G81_13010 [Lachnospiraceae bacterium]|nr:hypothetical protein [Lachnospiraceae bacterium]